MSRSTPHPRVLKAGLLGGAPTTHGRAVFVTRPAAETFSWQDSETLLKEEGWAETVFDCSQRGRRVDHVRLIARAKSKESRIVLVMEK